jgi:hypothetical protein
MPKDGKNRRSGRDEPRGNDLAGDDDYDWIRYLGEGRSSSSSAVSAQPPAQTVMRPAARPAPLPQRVPRGEAPRSGGEPAGGGRRAGRGVLGRGAGPSSSGSGPAERDAVPRGRGPDREAGRGRGGELAGSTDLLFNPHADEYAQPLYSAADDGQRPAMPPQQDWQQQGWQRDWPHEDRPTRPRGERLPQRRLDTAEYARPLYPDPGAGRPTAARPPRSWPDDEPLADTDAGGQAFPGVRGASPGRSVPTVRSGSAPVLPERVGRTGRQRRVKRLSPANPAEGTGLGLAAARASRSAGPTAAFPAATSSQRTIADPPAGPGIDADARAPQITPQVQPPVRGKPARKPRKTSGSRAGQGGRSGRKGRPTVGQTRSGASRRVPMKVMIMLGSVIVAALAVVGYVVLRPQASHVVSAPASLGGYVRQQANATANDLRHRIVAAAGGAVKNVVAAVYERTTGPGTNKAPQIVVFIGGNLAGGASADSLISAYMTRLRGAFTTSAGSLGGQAACAPGSNGGPAECAWADNDTFGVVVSATLNSAGLADVMRQIRPQVEHVAR